MKPLVSVIMPSYNSEKHIADAIQSLQAQTFEAWELCITDDCSIDRTTEIVKDLAAHDDRIRLFVLEENSGAASARNKSLTEANGRYVAYLDSDDVWHPNKLKHQIEFMNERGASFSCCSYEVIDEDGKPLGKTVQMLDKCDYADFLTHNLLQTVGIMADTQKVDRSLLVMPDLRRRQDAATWLQVLKAGHICYGLPDVLCSYRRVSGSLSSNKIKAAKGVWYLYRRIEHLPLHVSLYCFARYAALAIWKRFYVPQRTFPASYHEKDETGLSETADIKEEKR